MTVTVRNQAPFPLITFVPPGLLAGSLDVPLKVTFAPPVGLFFVPSWPKFFLFSSGVPQKVFDPPAPPVDLPKCCLLELVLSDFSCPPSTRKRPLLSFIPLFRMRSPRFSPCFVQLLPHPAPPLFYLSPFPESWCTTFFFPPRVLPLVTTTFCASPPR